MSSSLAVHVAHSLNVHHRVCIDTKLEKNRTPLLHLMPCGRFSIAQFGSHVSQHRYRHDLLSKP